MKGFKKRYILFVFLIFILLPIFFCRKNGTSKKEISNREYVKKTSREERTMPGSLNKEQQGHLLELARKTIRAKIHGEPIPAPGYTYPIFKENRGAFVTLHIDGNLRGCIGYIKAYKPLEQTIIDMALSAAFSDTRFRPLSKEEYDNIDIEISVLSPLKEITNIDEIEMGKHGVIISKGLRGGVFLPQVATETGWSKKEFLENLCSHKAGLPPDAYLDKDTKIEIFSAQVFSEK